MGFPRRNIFRTICFLLILIGVESAKKKIERTLRIDGGDKTTISKVPYIVQLRNEGGTFCGGTLITPKFAITAAHCVDGEDTSKLIVVGGATTINEKGVQSKVAKVTMHTDYKEKTTHSDIAVIELATELKGKNIQVVPLCKRHLQKGDFIQTSGWGKLKHSDKTYPNDLYTVRLPVRSQAECKKEWGDHMKPNMFCASGKQPKGICQGDSGGPAMFNGRLCGVNAFVDECGGTKYSQGFTDIMRTRDFIDKAMGKNALKD